jgi:putative transposase
MRQSRFTEERIISILRARGEIEDRGRLPASHGISSATFEKRKAKYGGLTVQAGRRQIQATTVT